MTLDQGPKLKKLRKHVPRLNVSKEEQSLSRMVTEIYFGPPKEPSSPNVFLMESFVKLS